MFQNFEDIGGAENGAARLQLLRQELRKRGLTGFLLPRSDEFQNEFVAPDAEQLLWLTGFSGSWGFAVILLDKAALIIDGRYTLQAAKQVDGAAYEIVHTVDQTISRWLEANLKSGDRFGYDPRLHTVAEIRLLSASFLKAEAELVALETNPIKTLWADRPAQSLKPVILQPIEFAGVPAQTKIANIQDELKRRKRDAVIVTALDSIAWLFNIRGQDLPHTPFVQSYAIVPATGPAQLFVDSGKIGAEVREAFSDLAEIADPAVLGQRLQSLGEQ